MDVPLIVALVTFFAVVLASSAVFLYFNSREALQTWRRRANGASAAAGSDATPAGMVDQLKAQLQDLLEWFARMNQPTNVEDIRATRLRLINAGFRSGKAPVCYNGRSEERRVGKECRL